ncbi:uncharacterized protein B0I36DRAFT_355968 [Microdochium trichocladiopsis]|uniref:Uncharacterized protein n=1 Tax=Microdochium trichocladiopsis TaxID=1682393 RepID=A0A9P8XRG7_9PEZI|nr:uncharacterized protein B0I36DRAFT_355968 [Microdochium trichocladiopsis]KAH7012572.1 hypothetical protein B0I36DRAFT_355968 [Microdochium trichocladiopsis]
MPKQYAAPAKAISTLSGGAATAAAPRSLFRHPKRDDEEYPSEECIDKWVGKAWSLVYDPDMQENWSGSCYDNPDEGREVINRMGQVLAKHSTGTTYVLMKPGNAPRAFWLREEYPVLAGKGITITTVNEDDTSKRKTYVTHKNP